MKSWSRYRFQESNLAILYGFQMDKLDVVDHVRLLESKLLYVTNQYF